DEIRRMRIRGERHRHAGVATRLKKLRMRIQLTDRLVQPRRRDLDGNARIRDRSDDRPVVERRGTLTEDLNEIGMRQRVEQSAASSRGQRLEVQSPGLLDAEHVQHPRLLAVDAEPVDEVHRPEQVVPRIRGKDRARLVFTTWHVVDLEPELHRQAALPRLEDRSHVRIDVVHAPLQLVRNLPQRTTLGEVVDVLREPDLVHTDGMSRRDERIDRPGVERNVLTRVTEMHVVVDDHSSAATRSRSPASVTLINFGSPSTTFTLPPRASTREEQSVAAFTSPAE